MFQTFRFLTETPSSDELPLLVCRYCTKSTNNGMLMMQHLRRWHRNEPLAARIRLLDSRTGIMGYQTKMFCDSKGTIITSELDAKYDIISIDFRKGDLQKQKRAVRVCHSPKQKKMNYKDSFEECKDSLHIIIDQLDKQEAGRGADFITVLQKIKNGEMSDQLSLLLLLDVGKRMRIKSNKQMRYSEGSKRFWWAFSKLGRGRMRNLVGGGRNSSMYL